LVSVSDFLTIACFKRLDSSFKQRAVDSDALLAKEVQKGGRLQSLNKFFDQYSIINILDILFSSNPNIHKSMCGLCFWAADPLIYRF